MFTDGRNVGNGMNTAAVGCGGSACAIIGAGCGEVVAHGIASWTSGLGGKMFTVLESTWMQLKMHARLSG